MYWTVLSAVGERAGVRADMTGNNSNPQMKASKRLLVS